ncbi:MAG: exodeoxyribonuclease VII large subunit, partial [Acidobacteriota bacterium]
ESAAYHDFLSSLGESGFGFEVRFVHAAVQGRQAESEVISALDLLRRQPVDCVVLVRGGGSRSDLAVFDSRGIAEAIADSPVPVLTGLGHQIDLSIADRAAHTALKTPTQAAEYLVQRVREGDVRIAELRRRLAEAALVSVREGREALGRAQRGLAVARFRLRSSERDVERLARALPRAAGRLLERHVRQVDQLERRIALAPMPILQAGRRRGRQLSQRIAST